MRSSLTNKFWAVVAAIAAVAPHAARAQSTLRPPQQHGEKIQFSEPSTPVMASNLTDNLNPGINRLNPAPSAFRQVQEDLFRPLANFHPSDSMEGVVSLPMPEQPRPAPDKRTRELMEQRRNWAFADLNDLYPEPSLEETFGVKQYGPDGREKKDLSLVEKFLENTGAKPKQVINPDTGQVEDVSQNGNSATNNANGQPATFREGEFLTKNAFAVDRNTEVSTESAATLASLALADAGALQKQSEKKRLEDFRHNLDPSLPAFKSQEDANAQNFTELLSPAPAPVVANALDPAKLTDEIHRNALNPESGFADPNLAALRTILSDDPTAHALGMPNPAPIKVLPPPQPTAQSIQAQIDPFAAHVLKPKF